MNKIETVTIGKIILNENTPQRNSRFEHFLIPYYQRGYRWETHHVEALLNDIHNFILSKEENYCLQPIVLAPAKDIHNLNIWEVIDGQQRLITLFIILQHIQKPKYCIVFGQRTKSTDFLQTLSKETYNHDNPDFHFMSNAYEVVSNWFVDKTRNDIGYVDEFYTTITKKIQVIWYQIDDLSLKNNELTIDEKEKIKIDIFNRLNVGKIPLTDAELIRALLLSKIKYGLTEREANMRQAEISNEWNFIETELRKDELWYFLNNDLKANLASRIEFIFSIIAGDKSKNYSTYLWFETTIKDENEELEKQNAFNLWAKTKSVFAKFKSWSNNRTLYHFTGFLLSENYSIKTILEKSYTTKPLFQDWLKSEIKNSINDISLNSLTYGNKNIEKIFLLFNILTLENLKNSTQNRFPFNYYKKVKYEDGGWSIEHIHAQQSELIKDDKAIRVWLTETLKSIENITSIEKEKEEVDVDGNNVITIENIKINSIYADKISNMLSSQKIDTDEFNELRYSLIDVFESSSVHEIDNLALLSRKDNSALNNSIFPVKRDKIIALEKEGKFIPPCTRNVFLKFYSNSDNQPYYWSKTDKELYFKALEEVIIQFLN